MKGRGMGPLPGTPRKGRTIWEKKAMLEAKQEIICRMMRTFDGAQDPDARHVRAILRRIPATDLRECYFAQRRGCGKISAFTGRCRGHYMARVYSPLIAATMYPQYFDARALETITGNSTDRNRARIEWAIAHGERLEDVINRYGSLVVA